MFEPLRLHVCPYKAVERRMTRHRTKLEIEDTSFERGGVATRIEYQMPPEGLSHANLLTQSTQLPTSPYERALA